LLTPREPVDLERHGFQAGAHREQGLLVVIDALAVVDDELRGAPVGVGLDDGGERQPAEMIGCGRIRPDGQAMFVGVGVGLADGRQVVGDSIAFRAERFVGNHLGCRIGLPGSPHQADG